MTSGCGFLVVDKPAGVTSFSMVALVRRLTGVRRVGHAGTLDPLASGVLPVAIGRATRLIEFMDDEAKEYIARVRFGEATDTFDAEGAVTFRGDATGLTLERVEGASMAFVGEVLQRPPLFSAIKLAGKPLYRYARAGITPEVKPRLVRIDRIAVRGFANGEAELEVSCGKGTYIRSIAHDLGDVLGCGAHLTGLIRTRSGGFAIADATSPDTLAGAAANGSLDDLLLAADRAVDRRAAAILAAPHCADVIAGRDVALEAPPATGLARVYSVQGEFLGVLRRLESSLWHPAKVFGASSGAN